MTTFRIKIVEKTSLIAEAVFTVDSTTVEAAAAEVLVAYRMAEAQGSSMIVLPNGQRDVLERANTAHAEVSMIEMDDAGNEIQNVQTSRVRRSLT